jgi:ribosome-binding ATPase YchF (GTP1/OBG family)
MGENELSDISSNNDYKLIQDYANKKNIHCIGLCGNIEMEISKITTSHDRKDFLEVYNLEEAGLDKLVALAYKQLGLITFFTAGQKEIRAWTINQNTLAPQAAGVIHSDFERGFIKADIYHVKDLLQHESETILREHGKIRQEGKDYLVIDGDVIFFKFNV